MIPFQSTKTFALALMMTTLTLPCFAEGGHGSGNGGDAVVCKNSVRLLDSIETEKAGFPPQTSARVQTIREITTELLSRYSLKDGHLAKNFEARAILLLADIENYRSTGQPTQANTIFGVGELPNVSDEGASFIPLGCEIKQLVVRTKDPLPNQKKYSIRADLLDRMSNAEISYTILHESIYGYLIDSKIDSSASARWLNGLIISNEILKMSSNEMLRSMQEYKFPVISISVDRAGVIYDPNDMMNDGSNAGNEKLSGEFDKDLILKIKRLTGLQMIAGDIEFQNGKIAKITGFDHSHSLSQLTHLPGLDDTHSTIIFDSNEKPVHYRFSFNAESYYSFEGGLLRLIPQGNRGQMVEGKHVLSSGKGLRGKNTVRFSGAVSMVKTQTGFEIRGGTHPEFKLVPACLVPVVGLLPLIMDQTCFREIQKPVQINMSEDFYIENVAILAE